MACEEQKSNNKETKSNAVTFCFIARNDVFCDLLQYRSTKKWNLFVLYYKNKRLNKLNEATTCENILLKYITLSDKVICACVLW